MSKNIISRKRKVQQQELEELSSTSSEGSIAPPVVIQAPKVPRKPFSNYSDDNKNHSLQDLDDNYNCGNTLKCKGCDTVFDGTKRMRFHKAVGVDGTGNSLMYKCDHNTKECKTTTYLVVRRYC
jgi:hypothetical protein